MQPHAAICSHMQPYIAIYHISNYMSIANRNQQFICKFVIHNYICFFSYRLLFFRNNSRTAPASAIPAAVKTMYNALMPINASAV